uniref:RUN domain-containing protein n=1 Tax=Gongylonema pulchrum TaxID=637853 RepID=A0A183EH49_9BILA
LLTEGGHQSLHHLCEDVSVPLSNEAQFRLSEFRTRTGDGYPAWFIELRNRLLQEGYGDTPGAVDLNVTSDAQRTHRRTVSDIPIFDDDDNESVETSSLDSLEHEVVETLQYMIECICAEEESELEAQHFFSDERTSSSYSQPTLITDSQLSSSEFTEKEQSSGSSASASQENAVERPPAQSVSSSKSLENGSLSISENVKRARGHRRQDSLQESIFSMSAQELKLFDTSELPRLEATGDGVQPLCHELHAHMLLYVESGRTVDLARSEKVFRMLIALMRAQRGYLASRLIISCMVSSGTASLPKMASSTTSGQLMDLLTRHIRAILGQDFWSSEFDNTTATDSLKNKHYTFLELFMTVSV